MSGLRRIFLAAASWLFLSASTTSAAATSLTEKQREELIKDIRGDDRRLMRWDASEHTGERQDAGACAKLPDAAATILARSSDNKAKTLAADFATFCITDNPSQRAIFSDQKGIHKAVVGMVGSKDSAVSAKAGHLIYIATYANEKNHQTFFKEGAVEALAKVVMNEKAVPDQVMWAAAALQNMAASYCATEDDGSCYWDWGSKAHVEIEEDSLPVTSDGSGVRKAMLAVNGLADALSKWACQGPVKEDEEEEQDASKESIFPGENAEVGRDETNPQLVPWAAAGALKNLALEPEAKKALEKAMPCFCKLKESADWLEEGKSNEALHFMRRADPCWFHEDGSGNLCIDAHFVDEDGFSCDEYDDPDEEACESNKDVHTGATAKEACCECGGGRKLGPNHEEL